MLVDHFPLYGLRVRTPRVELRLAGLEEMAALADVATAGVHDPAVMPFAVEWTDAPVTERGRGLVQHQWRMLAGIAPEAWELPLVAFVDGAPVGVQDILADEFGVLRAVHTGSWLGRPHQGLGLGTQMRAAAVHLAFAGLGARYALSEAFEDNTASNRVSVKLGYEFDGLQQRAVRGVARMGRRYRLSRERWERHRTIPVEMTGVEPCRALLGAASA